MLNIQIINDLILELPFFYTDSHFCVRLGTYNPLFGVSIFMAICALDTFILQDHQKKMIWENQNIHQFKTLLL